MASADAASLTIESTPVRLDRVVEDELRRLRHRFEAKGMHVHVGLLPSWVMGDSARLGQVAGNLLVNAARYGRTAGNVTVKVDSNSRVVTLTVSDDGPGIPEEERDHIFGQFARGSTAKGMEGSGIGLAVVRELVTAHAGKISVGRSIQGGAQFTVTLPKAPAPRNQSWISTETTHQVDSRLTSWVSDGHVKASQGTGRDTGSRTVARLDPPRGGDHDGQAHSSIIPPRPRR
jgi:signal transduction histidine kinase